MKRELFAEHSGGGGGAEAEKAKNFLGSRFC